MTDHGQQAETIGNILKAIAALVLVVFVIFALGHQIDESDTKPQPTSTARP